MSDIALLQYIQKGQAFSATTGRVTVGSSYPSTYIFNPKNSGKSMLLYSLKTTLWTVQNFIHAYIVSNVPQGTGWVKFAAPSINRKIDSTDISQALCFYSPSPGTGNPANEAQLLNTLPPSMQLMDSIGYKQPGLDVDLLGIGSAILLPPGYGLQTWEYSTENSTAPGVVGGWSATAHWIELPVA